MKKNTSAIFLTLTILGLGFSPKPSRADVPRDLEPQYSQAVLAFNGRNYDEALKILIELQKQSPDTSEFQELLALSYKASEKTAASEKAYLDLIALKKKQGKDPKEIATYYFELGTLYYKRKDDKKANAFFEFSLKNDLNKEACHFYLGLIDFKQGNFALARGHFSAVIAGEVNDLKPASHFYLAQIDLKTQYPQGATHQLTMARESAGAMMESSDTSQDGKTVAKQILEASQNALAPLDKSQWFGSVALTSGYDSNVLAVPGSAAETLGASSIASNLQASIGYMSSPMNTIQFIPSYKLGTSYNFSETASSGNFLTNTLSIYATRKPLAPSNLGLKAVGAHSFRKESGGSYSSYNFSGSIGPYYKTELSPREILGAEAFYEPQIFFSDTGVSESLKRSGPRFATRLFFQDDKGRKFWNPTYSLLGSMTITSGTEYSNRSLGLNLSNSMYLNDQWKLAINAGLTFSYYLDRSPNRIDRLLSSQLSLTRTLTRKWSLLGEIGYFWNASSIASSYAYNRMTVMVGANYAVF